MHLVLMTAKKEDKMIEEQGLNPFGNDTTNGYHQDGGPEGAGWGGMDNSAVLTA